MACTQVKELRQEGNGKRIFGAPDLLVEADEVHVDVTFTADKDNAGICRDPGGAGEDRRGGVRRSRSRIHPRALHKYGYTFTSPGLSRPVLVLFGLEARDPLPRLLMPLPLSPTLGGASLGGRTPHQNVASFSGSLRAGLRFGAPRQPSRPVHAGGNR